MVPISFLGCDLDPAQGVKQFKFESWDPLEGLPSYLVFVHQLWLVIASFMFYFVSKQLVPTYPLSYINRVY